MLLYIYFKSTMTTNTCSALVAGRALLGVLWVQLPPGIIFYNNKIKSVIFNVTACIGNCVR